MRHLRTLLVALAALFAFGFASTAFGDTTDIKRGSCHTYAVTSTSSDYFINTNGSVLTVQFEADIASNGTGTEVQVNGCTKRNESDANRCAGYYWDSDYDGADDTQTLTGSSWPVQQRYIVVSNVAGQLYLNTTVHDEDGEITVCAISY